MCAPKRTSTASRTSFRVLERRAQHRTFLTCLRQGALDNELATSRVLLFRRRVSRQCRAAFRWRRYGRTLSDPVRKTSGKGSLVLNGECSLGLREFRLRLSACAARRRLRSAIHRLHRAVCSRRTAHQPPVGTPFRSPSRRQHPGARMSNPLSRAFRALENFNFRLWTAGGLVSNIGTWMQRVAQDWIVLTQLTHHDATAVGIVTGLQFAPQLLLLPWTGLAADRFNQRKLLMLTQTTMGVLALILGVLTIEGATRLWHVYVFAFLFGSAAALDAPVRQTFVAELVGDAHLPNAVALNSTSFNAARMIGPALAGLLIAKVGTGWAFLINGISFAGVLISMSLFRVSELQPSVRATRAPGGFMEGFRYVWGRADLRAIMIMLFFIGTFGLNFPIFISTMAVKVF